MAEFSFSSPGVPMAITAPRCRMITRSASIASVTRVSDLDYRWSGLGTYDGAQAFRRLRVHRRGPVIKHQDGRVRDQCTSKTDALPLPSR